MAGAAGGRALGGAPGGGLAACLAPSLLLCAAWGTYPAHSCASHVAGQSQPCQGWDCPSEALPKRKTAVPRFRSPTDPPYISE